MLDRPGSNVLHLPLPIDLAALGSGTFMPVDLALLTTSYPAVCTAALGLLMLSLVLLDKVRSD